MIINALKNKIFLLSNEDVFEDEGRDEGERDDEFYTPRELETIPEFPDIEDKEETPRDCLI